MNMLRATCGFFQLSSVNAAQFQQNRVTVGVGLLAFAQELFGLLGFV